MHYKHNIHNKNQTSTIKPILRSHLNALNTARGQSGLDPDRNAALLQLHVWHDLGYGKAIRNKRIVHNTIYLI
jgi:hypothetical protein